MVAAEQDRESVVGPEEPTAVPLRPEGGGLCSRTTPTDVGAPRRGAPAGAKPDPCLSYAPLDSSDAQRGNIFPTLCSTSQANLASYPISSGCSLDSR